MAYPIKLGVGSFSPKKQEFSSRELQVSYSGYSKLSLIPINFASDTAGMYPNSWYAT